MKDWKKPHNGPYAVILSDFLVPKMDGIKFLSQGIDPATNSVRMILPGNIDQPLAIDIINKEQLFRFLFKPCSGRMLIQSLEAG